MRILQSVTRIRMLEPGIRMRIMEPDTRIQILEPRIQIRILEPIGIGYTNPDPDLGRFFKISFSVLSGSKFAHL